MSSLINPFLPVSSLFNLSVTSNKLYDTLLPRESVIITFLVSPSNLFAPDMSDVDEFIRSINARAFLANVLTTLSALALAGILELKSVILSKSIDANVSGISATIKSLISDIASVIPSRAIEFANEEGTFKFLPLST